VQQDPPLPRALDQHVLLPRRCDPDHLRVDVEDGNMMMQVGMSPWFDVLRGDERMERLRREAGFR
jgi:hypothetical protein